MVTKEVLNDLNIYMDSVETIPVNISESNAVTFRGDMHGLAKHKMNVNIPELHPLIVSTNGFTSTLEYDDSIHATTIGRVDGRSLEDFVEFLKSNY